MKRVPITQHAPLANDRISEFPGERRYLATGSVNDDGALAPELVTYESRPSRADLSARLGDVCFARMQATKKVLRIDEAGADTILSTGFAVLRPNPEHLYSDYLRSWVASDAFQLAKDRLCTGSTQKAITNAEISRLPIPVPPLMHPLILQGVRSRRRPRGTPAVPSACSRTSPSTDESDPRANWGDGGTASTPAETTNASAVSQCSPSTTGHTRAARPPHPVTTARQSPTR